MTCSDTALLCSTWARPPTRLAGPREAGGPGCAAETAAPGEDGRAAVMLRPTLAIPGGAAGQAAA